MQVKTTTLNGFALNWAVATARGFTVHHNEILNSSVMPGFWVSGYYPGDLNSWVPLNKIAASTDWAQGGSLMSEAQISRTIDHSGLWIAYWTDGYTEGDEGKKWMQCDRSELIAGLRCFVAREMGDVVNVPDELFTLEKSEPIDVKDLKAEDPPEYSVPFAHSIPRYRDLLIDDADDAAPGAPGQTP